MAVVERHEVGLPALPGTVLGPDAALQHVAAGRRDHAVVPVVWRSLCRFRDPGHGAGAEGGPRRKAERSRLIDKPSSGIRVMTL